MPAQRKLIPTPTGSSSDHRERLITLRDRLTAELDLGPSAAAVAALARQLQAVLERLASMAAPEGPNSDAGPSLEVFRQRRAARRVDVSGLAGP